MMEKGLFVAAVLAAAFVLDLVAGDPEGMPHPVRWIGRLVSALESVVRRVARTPRGLRLGGAAMALVAVAVTYGAAAGALYLASTVSAALLFVLSVYLVWTGLAVRSLGREAAGVIRSLDDHGLGAARRSVARIVGRDTGDLSREEVLRATAETVSENTSDGCVAPLFYLAIGGPPLMLAYKAVNTLDSMVGYRCDRYRDLGRFAARLDDAVNYVPARLTALAMVAASLILGYDWRGAVRILARDGRRHPSPNAGLPEAAAAGALGLRFGGRASYGGVVSDKPSIGDDTAELGPGAVTSTVRLMQVATALVAAAVMAVWLWPGPFPVLVP